MEDGEPLLILFALGKISIHSSRTIFDFFEEPGPKLHLHVLMSTSKVGKFTTVPKTNCCTSSIITFWTNMFPCYKHHNSEMGTFCRAYCRLRKEGCHVTEAAIAVPQAARGVTSNGAWANSFPVLSFLVMFTGMPQSNSELFLLEPPSPFSHRPKA